MQKPTLTTNERPRAYSYVRMSTEQQLLGDSLRRQIERSREYATAHGLDLVEDYHDLGVSAFRGANVVEGKLGAFLRAVKANKVPRGSSLLVENLDRLSRQEVRKSLRIFLDVIDAGIAIVTLIDKHVYTAEKCDAMELMMSIMVLSRANEESETKRDRASQAWANKRANAKTRIVTAACPKWLKLSADRKRFEVIEARAKIVRTIFQDSANGLGNYIITKRLNENRIRPFGPGRKDKQGTRGWQTCSVRKILSSRAVLGEFQPHHYVNGKRVPVGDPIPNYFGGPIIDEDLFYLAQQGRRNRSSGRGGRKGPGISNLFQFVGIEGMITTENKTERHGACPKHAHHFRSIPTSWEDSPALYSLVLWSGVLLGLDLLLLLHHRRRTRLVVRGRRLIH
jgi:DNA invertase Pin-like site-specific DNA recombinase